jgi:hypothetical protein
MRAKKTYTGNKDGVAAGERPGLTELSQAPCLSKRRCVVEQRHLRQQTNAGFQESVCACHRQGSRP